jgi:outer membrane protein assembly factor BamB
VLYFGVGAHANLVEAIEDRLFYALDARTGEELWTFKADGPVFASATLGQGTIYFKTLNNVLYALH